jgi:hypothetical protein
MNQFESLCKLASDEGWCWKLGCTTCWGAHFRYAFLELAVGKSRLDKNWIIHRRITQYSKLLGPFPKRFTEEQKVTILKICNDADISSIASSCRFPDWLGYLGLVLYPMYFESEAYKALSSSWATQLADLVNADSPIHARLREIAEGKGILNIDDLESCESSIMDDNFLQEISALSHLPAEH